MEAKTILIRALKYLETEPFVSKNDSAMSGGDKRSTADVIETSLDSNPDTSPEEELKYSKLADEVIDWVTKERGSSDYMMGCFNALELVKTSPQKTYGLLASLVNSYLKSSDLSYDTSAITIPNNFLADPGVKVSAECTVLKVNKFRDFKKVMMVSDGYLVTYSENNDKVKTIPVAAGDKVLVTGTVSRNKFTTPFETALTRVKVEKIA